MKINLSEVNKISKEASISIKKAKETLENEPTNHLDVEAKEELKKAIREFKGTVVLVSHEPDFYMDIVTEVWNVENWTTKVV